MFHYSTENYKFKNLHIYITCISEHELHICNIKTIFLKKQDI